MLDLIDAGAVVRVAGIATLTTQSHRTASLTSRLVHPLWSDGGTDGRILTLGRSPKTRDIERNPSITLSFVAGPRHLLIEATATISTGEAVRVLRSELAAADHGYRAEDFWSQTDLDDLVAVDVSATRMELSTFETGELAVARWDRAR